MTTNEKSNLDMSQIKPGQIIYGLTAEVLADLQHAANKRAAQVRAYLEQQNAELQDVEDTE